jgi:hypothetical protein
MRGGTELLGRVSGAALVFVGLWWSQVGCLLERMNRELVAAERAQGS